MTDQTRSKLAIVLDYDNLDDAVATARIVQPWFGVAKIGLELWSAAGVRGVTTLQDLGYDVFLDVKLHDIPNTVGAAARVLSRLGLKFLNAHAAGGEAMLRAFVEGANSGATDASTQVPCLLAVTVLTSDTDVSAFEGRLSVAASAGCSGVVCSGHEARRVKSLHPGLLTMVPGVRLAGSDVNDQARVMTPSDAVRAGSDVLVVGRTVTHATDIEVAAQQVYDEIDTL